MSRKLLQCPCGGQPTLMKFGASWIAECGTCSQNSGAFSTPEMAASMWNRKIEAIAGIVEIRVKRIRETARLPERKHPGDIGLDLYAAAVERKGGLLFVYSGLQVELAGMPVYGYQLRPRSSIYKTGLVMANSIGTIESTYRGELICVFLIGRKPDIPEAEEPYDVDDRFCQLCLPETIDPRKIVITEVDRLSDTERGTDGLGSTGRNDKV